MATREEIIRKYVIDNIDNPKAIAEAAAANGVTIEELSRATNIPVANVTGYFANNAVTPPGLTPIYSSYVDQSQETPQLKFTNTVEGYSKTSPTGAVQIFDTGGQYVRDETSTASRMASNFGTLATDFVLPAIATGVGANVVGGLLGGAAAGGAAAGGLTAAGAGGTGLGLTAAGGAGGLTAGGTGLGLTAGGAGGLTAAGAGGLGSGLTLGSTGLGLTAAGTGLGLTAGSLGASTIGAGLGSTLAGVTTGVGAGLLGGGLGSTLAGVTTGVGAGALGSTVGSTLGAAAGGLTAAQIAAAISGGLQTAGGLMQGQSNVDAARIQAQALTDAAKIAADEARFRPVGVTTKFGTSNFVTDPVTGRVTSAGYTLTPEMKAYQDRMQALSATGLTQAEGAASLYAPLKTSAEGLFKLGASYAAETPEQVAAKYISSQQALLQPGRERSLADLQNKLYQQGRSGVAVGATGPQYTPEQLISAIDQSRKRGFSDADIATGLSKYGFGTGRAASSPEMEAYYNAQMQADAQLAAGAQQAGQQQYAFGQGLFGAGAQALSQYQQGQVGAYDPYKAAMAGVTQLEELGQQPFQLGMNIGSKNANPTGANALFQGGTAAAQASVPANQYNPFASVLAGAGGSASFTDALAKIFGT